jgi:hypothetical protein
MTHGEAVNGQLADKLLLDELVEPELSEFREHCQNCEECAQDVRVGAGFVAGIRAVFKEVLVRQESGDLTELEENGREPDIRL